MHSLDLWEAVWTSAETQLSRLVHSRDMPRNGPLCRYSNDKEDEWPFMTRDRVVHCAIRVEPTCICSGGWNLAHTWELVR